MFRNASKGLRSISARIKTKSQIDSGDVQDAFQGLLSPGMGSQLG